MNMCVCIWFVSILFFLFFSIVVLPTDLYVCVSLLLLIYHLLSTQEMCEKKIKWKRKERKRESTQNSIVSSNSNSSAMPLLTCLSTLIHIYTVIIKAACVYQSYSSCQTSRECICCAPDVSILFCQWTIHDRWSNLIFQCLFIFLFFAILNNSRSLLLLPSLSCTCRFMLLEIGLLSRSLAWL
jgi:hypothetical protein